MKLYQSGLLIKSNQRCPNSAEVTSPCRKRVIRSILKQPWCLSWNIIDWLDQSHNLKPTEHSAEHNTEGKMPLKQLGAKNSCMILQTWQSISRLNTQPRGISVYFKGFENIYTLRKKKFLKDSLG